MEIGSVNTAAYQPATVQKRPALADTAASAATNEQAGDDTGSDTRLPVSGTAADTAADTGDGTDGSNASALKSFAYGTLGLERPDQQQEEKNQFYSAGKWVAAAVTIGGIISLFV